MTDNDDVERVARAMAHEASTTEMGSAGFNARHRNEYVEICWRDHEDRARAAITAYLSAMPERELLAEALEALENLLEACIASIDDKARARAAADKIRAALTQEPQT